MTHHTSIATYEAQVTQFKPVSGLAGTNLNDLRLFIYEWFTHFEHAAPVEFYLGHLDDKKMHAAFPGMTPLASHAEFIAWYNNRLAQTEWNFHEVSAIRIEQKTPREYLVSFVLDWYGKVKAASDQVAGWQSRSDSFLYHHKLRQTWTVEVADRLLITKLLVTGADASSP